jgi:AcrR family transcriptional regulator
MSERLDTKSRILDVAERLFGLKGFEATSLRDITAEAQVNLAAVNYHFQSKESLIDAVIIRRIEPVNHRRLEMLDSAGPHPTLEQILTAFIAPALEVRMESVAPLMGRILSDPNQFIEKVFKTHLRPMLDRFSAELGKALPEIPEAERAWRLMFMAGVMTHVMRWSDVLPQISGGLCDGSDRHALTERAVAFLAAGFRAPVPQSLLQESLLKTGAEGNR